MSAGGSRLARETELRHAAAEMVLLVNILESGELWKLVMSLAPLDPAGLPRDHDHYPRKYSIDDISVIESYAKTTQKLATLVFFDDWGTSGRKRPTLDTLKRVLDKTKIIRAIDEMAQLLGDPIPPKPSVGPGAPVDLNLPELSLEEHLHDIATIEDEQLALGTTYNRNIDKPHNGQNGRKKDFPNFNNPGYNSTRNMESSVDFIEFSQKSNLPLVLLNMGNNHKAVRLDTASSSHNNQTDLDSTQSIDQPKEVAADSLPMILRQHDYQMSFPDIQLPPIQSSLENGPSQQDSCDIPVGISSFNRTLPGVNYQYEDIKQMTRNFSDHSDVNKHFGGKIGEGGFGTVYVGFSTNLQPIAIKVLHKKTTTLNLMKQFYAEIEMTHFRHENIIKVLGYSTDGPDNTMCIVSEYISGGNLRDKLNEKTLNAAQRFEILLGTARGLQFLHSDSKYLIHKDVKSANILLTEECIPKLCDFGLTRLQDNDTTQLIGTSVYLAPEAIHGDITPMMDLFSFGIVTLEVLTGRGPIIPVSSTTKNIQTFVTDELNKIGDTSDITPLLDSSVGDWPMANSLYDLAKKCLAERKVRLDADGVCEYLEGLCKSTHLN